MESIKSTWTLEKFFEEVRASQKHPDGSVCLTKDTQEHLVKLVDRLAMNTSSDRHVVLLGIWGPFVLSIYNAYRLDSSVVKYIKAFGTKKEADSFIENNYCKTTKKFKHEQVNPTP